MVLSVNTETPHLMVKILTFSIVMILSCSIATFAKEADKNRGEETQVSKKTIEEVLKEHSSKLMSIPGVVGTGQSICNGQPCIKVFVSRKTEELERKIPKTLEGYPVVIQESGKFKALPDN